ncbi:hypothetical protein [Actinomadura sp. WMMA1423]|uniref:hypothetical protein n=1 Tax=Actinomadura sp. WMMA1423 TaxID=2591108 RepID=UPI0011475BB4|nr:hypothetical protein [Actinomadura sp. WMMA1423]
MATYRRAFLCAGASLALSAGAMTAASPAVSAQPAPPGRTGPQAARAYTAAVHCSTTELTSAINTGNSRIAATIQLAPNCTYNYTAAAGPASALPQITGRITLVGRTNTKIIRDPSATDQFRVVDVALGATFQATNVSFEGGDVDGDGGGIRNNGTTYLTLTNIRNNTATGDGGGLMNGTGASALVSSNSLISGNSGFSGGGVANYGNVRIATTRITGNTSPQDGGGGVYTSESGNTTISSSRIDSNFAEFAGGGVLNYGVTALYGVVIENNQNSATEGFPGGGVYNVIFNIPKPGVVISSGTTIRANIPDNCYPPGTIRGCAP